MTASKLLRSGERIDELLIDGLRIIQTEQRFCVTLDAVLLAHFAFLCRAARAVDLGAGTGVIGLLLMARGAAQVTGVELNPDAADMARRSITLNNAAEHLSVITGDVCKVKNLLPAGIYDLVTANPPYRQTGRGLVSPSEEVAMARHETAATLADFIAAARYLVRYRGRFAMVQLPERLPEIMSLLCAAGLEPKRLQLVYPFIDRKPKLLLIEAVRGGQPGLEVLPPLIVYGTDGSYTSAVTDIYGKKEQMNR